MCTKRDNMNLDRDGMAGKSTMQIRALIPLAMAIFLLAMTLSETVRADSEASPEYRLKAAFLYNFMMFVDGGRFDRTSDPETPSEPNEPIQIGIIGKTPFGNAFEPLRDRKFRNRPVTIKAFKGLAEMADADGRLPQQHPQLDALRQCHMLFICSSEQSHLETLLNPIKTLDILTVADGPGFLEAGGMVNFLIENKKVRFEVNTAATGRAKLQIRAKLLRLAKRVITHDAFEKQDDKETETQPADK
jgi:hypothetical protein